MYVNTFISGLQLHTTFERAFQSKPAGVFPEIYATHIRKIWKYST